MENWLLEKKTQKLKNFTQKKKSFKNEFGESQ